MWWNCIIQYGWSDNMHHENSYCRICIIYYMYILPIASTLNSRLGSPMIIIYFVDNCRSVIFNWCASSDGTVNFFLSNLEATVNVKSCVFNIEIWKSIVALCDSDKTFIWEYYNNIMRREIESSIKIILYI